MPDLPRQKKRLDVHLVDAGFFESRARAQAAIRAGAVRVGGVAASKGAMAVCAGDEIIVADRQDDFVSRGGVKLSAALDAFDINPQGLVCLDLGASTGGFTDVLLRRGAAQVYAVDVGRDQLHPKLRKDARVVNLEKTHAKQLTRAAAPKPFDLIVVDVSFISLRKVLPYALPLAARDARLVALVKPQFEVGPENIGKGGLVRPGRENAEGVVEAIAQWLDETRQWRVAASIESPIKGGDGNREFLLAASSEA
ncbi:MAG: TlyA family RNA methyltransferase [Pseudomonadota bacterium]